MLEEDDPEISPPSGWKINPSSRLTILLVVGLLSLVSLVSRPFSRQPGQALGAQESTPSPTLPPPTETSTTTPLPVIRATSPALPTSTPFFQTSLSQGMIFLAMEEGGFSHLFAYQPVSLPFTRLTEGPWDDITPALSPDGTRLAFASNRDGPWDLYLLELSTGQVTRLTDTPGYEASPSWSPDSMFLAYESYQDNLEVMILPLSGEGSPVALTGDPAADFSPAWSPDGRKIAFVSTRSGGRDVWLADLDRLEDQRFSNLSQDSQADESFPDWSPNGKQLAWASQTGGLHQVIIWDSTGGLRPAGSGDWPLWSPDGESLLTTLAEPNRTLLTAYRTEGALLDLPPLILPGKVVGMDWGKSGLPDPLPEPLAQVAGSQPETLWLPILTPTGDVPNGRQHLAELAGVQAPFPELHDQVDEAFFSLKERVSQAAGWDFLASLENAYVPLTAPLPPGLGQDWLYTGRAFAFSPLPVDAGWVVVIPEQFGTETYWRIYLRARSQDGFQGRPLVSRPWDFSARYSGDLNLYEQGGRLAQEIPPGYWIDFTVLAAAYGWDRLPVLPAWRSAVTAARYNEFAMSAGLSWQEAMLELYPPEALLTPTAVLPPTMTPTRTPSWPRPTPIPP
jgi:TolB protein